MTAQTPGPVEQWGINAGVTVDTAIAGSLEKDIWNPHGAVTEDVVSLPSQRP